MACGKCVGIGEEAHRARRIDRVARRGHLEEHPGVRKVRPAHQAPRPTGGRREILERIEDESHLLGVAAREAAATKFAQDVDAARIATLATMLVAIQVEHQCCEHDRVIGRKSASRLRGRARPCCGRRAARQAWRRAISDVLRAAGLHVRAIPFLPSGPARARPRAGRESYRFHRRGAAHWPCLGRRDDAR